MSEQQSQNEAAGVASELNALLGCPFCGATPETIHYPTLIIIRCAECEKSNRKVEVFGKGYYSDWISEQKADEHGMVRIAAELNPVSDTDAYRRLIAEWNVRPNDPS